MDQPMRRHGPTAYELLLADLASGLGAAVLVWSVAAIVLGRTLLPYTSVAGGALAGTALGIGAALVLAAGDTRRRRALLGLALSALGLVAALLVVLGAVRGRVGPIAAGATFLVARILTGVVRSHAARRGYRPRWFSSRSFETMVATAETMLDADGREAIPPEHVAERTDHLLDVIDTPIESQIRLLFIALEWALPLLLLGRPLPFTALGRQDRRALAIKLTRSTGTFRTIARTMKVLTCAGYYSDPRAKAAVGFVEYEGSARSAGADLTPLHYPDPNTRGTPRSPRMGSSEEQFDAIVIGSGASGAVMAYELTRRAGMRVAVVERGRHEDPTTFEHDELAMFTRVYKDGGLQTAADRNTAIFQGQTVGGSTVINNAIWLRADLDRVLREWAARGAVVPRAELEAAYSELEGNLHVTPIDRRVANPGTELFLKGAGSGGALLHNNRDKCLGCGWCNYGCKYNRKVSMLVSYIPWGLDRGVTLYDQVSLGAPIAG
jgi:hypothetical protein